MAQYQVRGARLDFSASNAGGEQGIARVAGLRDGGFAVTWAASDTDRALFDGDLYGIVFNANLAPVNGGVRQLITDTGPGNSYPANQSVSRLHGGGFAVLSVDDANYSAASASSNRDAAIRIYDGNGAAVGQPIYLGAASILGLSLTSLNSGRLVAAWTDAQGSLRAQYLTAEGTLSGSSSTVAQLSGDIPVRPDVASLSNGGWVATYVSSNSNTASAVFYNAQGQVVSTKAVASNLTNIEGLQTYELADGRVVFVWAQQQLNSQLETHAQLYSPSGVAFGSELTLSSTASSISSVTGLSDGGFVVAFELGGGGVEIKTYNSIGQNVGNNVNLANSFEPSVAALADGGFVVTWKDSVTSQFHAQAYQSVAAGNQSIVGTAGADVLVGQEGHDTITGAAGADQLYGSVGDDFLSGGAANDVLDGGTGFDMLYGGAGSDTLFGNLGFDQTLSDGSRRTYDFNAIQQGGQWVTTVSGGPETGVDTLIEIERASFVDGYFEYRAETPQAQIMRLYNAAFDRPNDQDGLDYWTGRLASGESLRNIGAFFVASPEFQSSFGNLTNQQYVEQLYQFTLGRAGQSADVQFWVDYIEGGATRGDVLLGFSESAEHQALTAGQLAQGLWVADLQASQVSRMYDAAFDRLPDLDGLTFWTDRLEANTSLEQMASGFMSSQEFQNRYGNLSNQDFIQNLYQFCLDRSADANDLSYWMGRLDEGVSRTFVLTSFSESEEHIALTRPLWSEGVQISDANLFLTADHFGATSLGEIPA